MNDAIAIPVQVAGHFTLETHRVDADGNEIAGSRRKRAEFPNLITDVGLEAMGTSAITNLIAHCRVGSGTATPQFTDTALASQVASTSTTQATASGAQASPPYYGFYRVTKRFAAGVAAGNLSEVGMASASTGGTLFSRALILDGLGAPTTITVLSDEVLDVTYEVRNYVPTGDTAWSATIGGVSYSGIVRAADATSVLWRGNDYPGGIWASGGSTLTVYNGSIGATVTNSPSGNSALLVGSNLAYAAQSKVRDFTYSAGLNDLNVTNGISAIKVHTAYGYYQFSVSPPIPKDATKTMTLTFRAGPWGRYTP